MSKNDDANIEPFRVLFLIGIMHVFFGTLIWILYAIQMISYPGIRHANHMIGGFLFSFIAGFLLTAIPNFTGTAICSKKELLISSSFAFSSLFFDSYLFILGLIIFLITFFFRKLSKRTFTPPPQFIFLPFGLLSGIFGAGILCMIDFQIIDMKYLSTGKLFFYYASILNIVLGVGSKLIPALLGWGPPPTTASLVEGSKSLNMFQRIFPIFLCLFLSFGFIIEAIGYQSLGRILRAAIGTIIGIKFWRIHFFPPKKTKMTFWLWISAWILIASLWVHALFPELNVHAAHLFFIGGFGMMTLLISSRVILSHGNHGLDLESNSKIYALCSSLLILAALTRFTAPWPPHYINHLGYAAFCLIIAILAWCIFFVPKVFFR